MIHRFKYSANQQLRRRYRKSLRNVVRDPFRRRLMVNVASSMNGSQLEGLSYGYDALNRTIARNSDIFGYNERSEVTGATVSGSAAEYAYDEIGNSATYTANNLNQYSQFQYDLDGNMTQYGDWAYTYDPGCRLVAVSSNDVLIASFAYDTQGRRVEKVTANGTHRYFHDGRKLVYEHITRQDGSVVEIDYVWGKDISGSRGGACGIGGLLYMKRNGVIYIPSYDAYGNILGYTDAQGNVVAEYAYNVFGVLVVKSGSMVDEFAFKFSTKYFDSESNLYCYEYRYYKPDLMRWLTEDPIGEQGGLNLYAFCGNNPVCRYDKDGRAYFAKRQLGGFGWYKGFSQNAVLDIFNIEVSHEHLFFGTPEKPLDDVGYFKEGGVRHDRERDKYHYVVVDAGYNDCVMRKAVSQVVPKPYCTLGFVPRRDNCQSYAQQLRNKYHSLMEDEKVLCECFGKSKKGNYIWMR